MVCLNPLTATSAEQCARWKKNRLTGRIRGQNKRKKASNRNRMKPSHVRIGKPKYNKKLAFGCIQL